MHTTRQAREADVPAMVACVEEFNRFISTLTEKTVKRSEPERYRRNLLEGMADPHRMVLVAEVDGLFAGYATGGVVNGEGVIGTIFVCEEHRLRAVGRDLITGVTTWLRGQGCSSVRTEVLPRNPASKFYRTLGFRRQGKFMTRDLADPTSSPST